MTDTQRCNRHPHQDSVGVCSWCLRERLVFVANASSSSSDDEEGRLENTSGPMQTAQAQDRADTEQKEAPEHVAVLPDAVLTARTAQKGHASDPPGTANPGVSNTHPLQPASGKKKASWFPLFSKSKPPPLLSTYFPFQDPRPCHSKVNYADDLLSSKRSTKSLHNSIISGRRSVNDAHFGPNNIIIYPDNGLSDHHAKIQDVPSSSPSWIGSLFRKGKGKHLYRLGTEVDANHGQGMASRAASEYMGSPSSVGRFSLDAGRPKLKTIWKRLHMHQHYHHNHSHTEALTTRSSPSMILDSKIVAINNKDRLRECACNEAYEGDTDSAIYLRSASWGPRAWSKKISPLLKGFHTSRKKSSSHASLEVNGAHI